MFRLVWEKKHVQHQLVLEMWCNEVKDAIGALLAN